MAFARNSSNNKNKKILIVLIVAFLFAGIAAFGIYQLLTPQRTTVYVFNSDYQAGTQVVSSMFTTVEIDNNVITNGNRSAANDYMVTGSNFESAIASAGYLRTDVYSGNILTTSTR